MTKEATNSIIALLDSDDWTTDGFTVDHRGSGLSLWVANGVRYLGVYHGPFHYDKPPFFMRRKLWRAVERMQSRMMQKKIYDSIERQVLSNFDKQIARR